MTKNFKSILVKKKKQIYLYFLCEREIDQDLNVLGPDTRNEILQNNVIQSKYKSRHTLFIGKEN